MSDLLIIAGFSLGTFAGLRNEGGKIFKYLIVINSLIMDMDDLRKRQIGAFCSLNNPISLESLPQLKEKPGIWGVPARTAN